MEQSRVSEILRENLDNIEEALKGVIQARDPVALYGPAVYVLASRGKRFRPQLVLAASDLFDGDRTIAMQVATAVEVFHVFTLVHDDIMDRAETRRGRETIHRKWDEPTAILTGDFLLGRATQLLGAFPDPVFRQVQQRFADTVTSLCEGQVRDMGFESRKDVVLEEYLRMIDQKTSALLQTCLVFGALTGRARSEDISVLDEIGHHLGRAFQIQDDLLDLMSESDKWGKPVGGDLIAAKKTYLFLKALELEQQHGGNFFADILAAGSMEPGCVEQARIKMNELGVAESAQTSVILHSDRALDLISTLPTGRGREVLVTLTQKMKSRLF